MEGKETGGPEGPAKSAMLGFAARASPDATETGHAPPERVARGDGPSHLSLINPDSAPAVPQPIGTSSNLHTTLNVSSTPLCKYIETGLILRRAGKSGNPYTLDIQHKIKQRRLLYMPHSELPQGTSGSVLSEGNNDSGWL